MASSEQTLINTINPSANDVTINFKRVKCEDVEGPIYLKFLAKCLDLWCKSEIHNNVTVKYNVGMISYTVGNLSSYTLYTLTMAASRNMIDWYRIQYDDFTTKSSGRAAAKIRIITD